MNYEEYAQADGEKLRLMTFDEHSVDLRRLLVCEKQWLAIKSKAAREMKGMQKLPEEEWRSVLKPRHLWFKARDLSSYEIKDGPAPHDRDRPEHLKGLNLGIDMVKFMENMVKSGLDENKFATEDKDRITKVLLGALP